MFRKFTKTALFFTAASGSLYYSSQYSKSPVFAEQKVPIYGVPGTNKERTFLMVKPDGVQRGLTTKILARFEEKGYKIVALKMVNPDRKLVAQHYADLKKRPFYNDLVDYMSTAGPVVAFVVEGKDCIRYGRVMIGKTDPLASDPGTIRGDYAVDIGRNVIHGSDGAEGAMSEIPLWFKESEVTDWESCEDKWKYE